MFVKSNQIKVYVMALHFNFIQAKLGTTFY